MLRKLAVAAATFVAAAGITTTAQAAVTSNTSVPLDIGVFVPCANGGAGDVVNLSGNLHILATTTFDASGGAHGTLLFNPQNVSGTGTVSGAAYRGTGETLTTFNVAAGAVFTFTNNFRIVGTGGAPTFAVHENVVLVVNANGTVTASVDNFRVTCG
jgi:hypothetical protein